MLPSMTSRFILSLQGRKDSAHPLTGHTDNLLLAFQSFHTTDISKKEYGKRPRKLETNLVVLCYEIKPKTSLDNSSQ